jgi:hypothetical protein
MAKSRELAERLKTKRIPTVAFQQLKLRAYRRLSEQLQLERKSEKEPKANNL